MRVLVKWSVAPVRSQILVSEEEKAMRVLVMWTAEDSDTMDTNDPEPTDDEIEAEAWDFARDQMPGLSHLITNVTWEKQE